ncbi:hypothetical protein MJT46_019060 [Ovis ammon polii x Ovis aries]|nr:hypothetical protein MJT46_019060 [Ovis ammon polii x Ovis aries]
MGSPGQRRVARRRPRCGEWGLPLIAAQALLIVAVSRAAERGFCSIRASVIAVLGLSFPVACGLFPDQRLNPCPLHWCADCSLKHQGSPGRVLLCWEMKDLALGRVSRSPPPQPGYYDKTTECSELGTYGNKIKMIKKNNSTEEQQEQSRRTTK